eukprot:Sdes_comp9670_c0_seq1m1173
MYAFPYLSAETVPALSSMDELLDVYSSLESSSIYANGAVKSGMSDEYSPLLERPQEIGFQFIWPCPLKTLVPDISSSEELTPPEKFVSSSPTLSESLPLVSPRYEDDCPLSCSSEREKADSYLENKRYRNKLAAEKCRKKKRATHLEVVEKLQRLEVENHRLKDKVSQLESELTYLKGLITVKIPHNIKTE